MTDFRIVTEFTPSEAQKNAVDTLARGLEEGARHQVLLGVTGSGKTFTAAMLVERVQRPTLVLAPNKTLAAQLYGEFKSLFPENAVEYFVSYYDYYQPEAYLPQQDLYIEKDSSINDRIDRLRHAATHALLTRRDVLIVASVSCIYGLGDPDAYEKMILYLETGVTVERDQVLRKLVDLQYKRNDVDFHRGTFRARGDVVEIFPSYEEEHAIRVEFFGDEVESIADGGPAAGEEAREPQFDPRAARLPLRHAQGDPGPGRQDDPGGTAGAPPAVPAGGQAPGGPAHRAAHDVRHRDDRGDGLLHGHRELLAPPHRPRPRRAAADAPRLLPRGFPPGGGREPHHHPPGGRHVPGRPLPQGDAGGVRLPAALARSTTGRCASTSSRPASARPSTSRPPRPRRSARRRRARIVGADRAPHRPRRSRDRHPAGPPPGGRPPRRDPRGHRAGRTGARHHAHQAHVRGPHPLLRRDWA